MNPGDTDFISEAGGKVLLRVYIQPRASKNRLVGLHNGELKVALTAPPVDNAANEALIRLLADLLSLPKSAVAIKSGHSSRHKTVAVTGRSVSEAKSVFGMTHKE